VCRLNELGAGDFDLNYIRDRQGHEVDFLITNDRKPCMLIEAKMGERNLTKSLLYFSKLLKLPCCQIVSCIDDAEAYPSQRYVVPAWRFLAMLG